MEICVRIIVLPSTSACPAYVCTEKKQQLITAEGDSECEVLKGGVEKITFIYTHFHFSFGKCCDVLGFAGAQPVSVWCVCMCVACADNGQTLLVSKLS